MFTAEPTYRIKQYSQTPLEDLLSEMSENREDVSNPEPKEPAPSDTTLGSKTPGESGTQPSVPETPKVVVDNSKEAQGKRQFTAKMLAKYTDQGFAFVCSLLADEEDSDFYKANDEDKKDLIECYFEMCEGYGWTGMPPWLNLVFCVGFTYGPKMRQAYKDGLINKEITRKAAQAEAEQAIAERKLRDAEAEIARLKNEAKVGAENLQPKNENLQPKNENPDGNATEKK